MGWEPSFDLASVGLEVCSTLKVSLATDPDVRYYLIEMMGGEGNRYSPLVDDFSLEYYLKASSCSNNCEPPQLRDVLVKELHLYSDTSEFYPLNFPPLASSIFLEF